MESIYYTKLEKRVPDKANRMGTEYYYGDKTEMIRAVEHGLKWLPLCIELFWEKSPAWISTKNKLVPKRVLGPDGKAKWGKRTPEETLKECIELMESCKEPIQKGAHWGIPRHCWDKVNKILEEGFDIIGAQDCFDDPNYGLQIEFIEGIRPVSKTPQKNNFFDIAEFLDTMKQRSQASKDA